MPTALINGIELYYETHGELTPSSNAMMLVAGLGSDSLSWQPVMRVLSQHYYVITLDNRGAGRTKTSDKKLSIQTMTDDCVGLIRHLDLSSVHVLGHSMGGFIALDCAVRYPDFVSKLILVGTAAFSPKRNNLLLNDWIDYLDSDMDLTLWFKNMFYWIFTNRFFENEELLSVAIQFAIEYPYRQSVDAFKNQVRAVTEFNCVSDLPEITSETMIICGKEDVLFSPEASIKQLQTIPGAINSVIEHAAHSIHMENPTAFTECVINFLNSRQDT